MQTRREFMITTAALAAVAATVPKIGEAWIEEPVARDDSRCLIGDPYLATTCEAGVGARGFEAMRERALRFHSTAEERDRFVLGWES